MPEPKLRFLRNRRGFSQKQLADEINRLARGDGHKGAACNAKTVSEWECGDHRPSDFYQYYLACALGVRRDELVYPPRKARNGIPPNAMAAQIGRPAGYAGHDGEAQARATDTEQAAGSETSTLGQEAPAQVRVQEVRAADRRGAIRSMTVLGVGVLAGGRLFADAADAAVAASRKRAVAGVDPMTLEELDQDVERFAREYHSTPHIDLFPVVWEDWRQVEGLLDGRPSLRDRARLTVLGGQLSYLLGRLSFHMGEYAAARKLAVLAWQYAQDVGQPVLCASVRMLQSSIAFYNAQPHKALDLLQAAEPHVTAYTRARAAAYAARAHAVLGDARSARQALGRMQDQLVDLPAEPGESPFTPVTAMLFLGGTYVRLGDGQTAERYAHQAVASYNASAMRGTAFSDRGHARLNLAASLVVRPRPDPDEAARLGIEALAVPEAQRTETVGKRAMELRGLLVNWRATSGVKEFGDRLRGYRPLALPAPTT